VSIFSYYRKFYWWFFEMLQRVSAPCTQYKIYTFCSLKYVTLMQIPNCR